MFMYLRVSLIFLFLASTALAESKKTHESGIHIFKDGIELQSRLAPDNPPSGRRDLFVDSITGEISARISSGTTVSLESGGGSSLTETVTTVTCPTNLGTNPGESMTDCAVNATGAGVVRITANPALAAPTDVRVCAVYTEHPALGSVNGRRVLLIDDVDRTFVTSVKLEHSLCTLYADGHGGSSSTESLDITSAPEPFVNSTGRKQGVTLTYNGPSSKWNLGDGFIPRANLWDLLRIKDVSGTPAAGSVIFRSNPVDFVADYWQTLSPDLTNVKTVLTQQSVGGTARNPVWSNGTSLIDAVTDLSNSLCVNGDALVKAGGVWTCAAPSGGTTHNLFSATHTDTSGTVAGGDIIYRNSGNTLWLRLAQPTPSFFGETFHLEHDGSAPFYAITANILTWVSQTSWDGTATRYAPLSGMGLETSSLNNVEMAMRTSIRIKDLFCYADPAPGAGESITIDVKGRSTCTTSPGGAQFASSCTISGTSKTCTDTADYVLSSGDCYGYELTSGAGAFAGALRLSCWLERRI